MHIIRRLKQQPRHGVGPTLADAAEVIRAFSNLTTANAAAAAQMVSTNEDYLAGIGRIRQMIKDTNDAYTEATKTTRYLSEENKDLAKNFGLTINEAVRLNYSLQKASKNFGVGGDALKKYTMNLKGLIGQVATQGDLIENSYGKSLYQIQEVLQENLQLSGEQANKYSLFAAFQNKTAEEALLSEYKMGKAIDEKTSTSGNFRDIIQDIASLSEDIQLQYSKIPGDLAQATAKARALGFSMNDLHKTGKQLLNIESSIGDELEYQLLSGRRLVDTKGQSLTNSYREAVFQRNATKQADTLLDILNQEGETLENNMFAREQMSKLLGMDEAALARALGKKKILDKIGGESLFKLSGEELFTAAKNLGASAADLEALKQEEDTRSIDQKMLANSDKMLSVVQVGLFGSADKADEYITQQQKEIKAVQQGFIDASKTMGEAIGPATKDMIGGAYTTKRKLIDTGTTTLRAMDFLRGTEIETVNLYPAEVVSNGGAELASGGVIPPGYPNDTYPAMLTSGETVIPAGESPVGNMAAFAAAIVNAINKQTDALTSNSGINAPYWS